MSDGFELGGRFKENPVGSEGRSASRRKAGNDPGWTPSEVSLKQRLMRQFMRNPEGPGGNSTAYLANYDAIDWSSA